MLQKKRRIKLLYNLFLIIKIIKKIYIWMHNNLVFKLQEIIAQIKMKKINQKKHWLIVNLNILLKEI